QVPFACTRPITVRRAWASATPGMSRTSSRTPLVTESRRSVADAGVLARYPCLVATSTRAHALSTIPAPVMPIAIDRTTSSERDLCSDTSRATLRQRGLSRRRLGQHDAAVGKHNGARCYSDRARLVRHHDERLPFVHQTGE